MGGLYEHCFAVLIKILNDERRERDKCFPANNGDDVIPTFSTPTVSNQDHVEQMVKDNKVEMMNGNKEMMKRNNMCEVQRIHT